MIGWCGKQRAEHADKLSKTAQTFVVKSIEYVGVSVFVVASENEKIFGKFNLVREHKADGLQALATAVYIVAGSTKWNTHGMVSVKAFITNSIRAYESCSVCQDLSIIKIKAGCEQILPINNQYVPEEQIV